MFFIVLPICICSHYHTFWSFRFRYIFNSLLLFLFAEDEVDGEEEKFPSFCRLLVIKMKNKKCDWCFFFYIFLGFASLIWC